MTIVENPIAIYFHWPFCLAKCPYCDFNVHVGKDINHDAWKAAYLGAVEYYAALTRGREVVSVFFGGGTPSLMEPGTVEAVLNDIKRRWPAAGDIEVTLEANPTSVETAKLEAFQKAGVNRVSLGVQSLNDADLKFLGRKHNAAQAIEAIGAARRIFGRVSFDLIYARPNQSLEAWRDELRRGIELAGGHMSLYQLTIERSTPFYFAQEQGKFTMPEEGLAADFYNLTQDVMEDAGLPAYEVSNHARAGEESRHNMVYWRYGDYVGIGPGAHGRLTLEGRKYATREHHAPEVWLKRMEDEGVAHHPFEEVGPRGRFTEALMMGLRLREGVPVSKLEAEGECALGDMLDMEKVRKMSDEKFLIHENGVLRLTREGMLRLNAVAPYVLK